jgi:hypothetical protein
VVGAGDAEGLGKNTTRKFFFSCRPAVATAKKVSHYLVPPNFAAAAATCLWDEEENFQGNSSEATERLLHSKEFF